MSHFYGSIDGSASTEATRCGTKNSGISGHIRGWDFGVRVRMYHSEDGTDVAYVELTSGSNGNGHNYPLGAFTVEDLHYPPRVIQAERDDEGRFA